MPASRSDLKGVKKDDIQRLSVSVAAGTRKNIRIAAALSDMSDGEWCATMLSAAADKATEKIGKSRASRKAREQ